MTGVDQSAASFEGSSLENDSFRTCMVPVQHGPRQILEFLETPLGERTMLAMLVGPLGKSNARHMATKTESLVIVFVESGVENVGIR